MWVLGALSTFFLLLKIVNCYETYEHRLHSLRKCEGRICLLPFSLRIKRRPPPPSTHSFSPKTASDTIVVGIPNIVSCNNSKSVWTPYEPDERLLLVAMSGLGPTKCVLTNLIDAPRYLESGIVDILGSSVGSHGKRLYDGFIYPHMQSDLCVVVKKVDPQPYIVLQSYSISTWLATGTSLLLIGFVLHLHGSTNVALETLRTFISGGFVEQPEHPRANALSLLLSVYGLIMITAFCARFMSFLVSSGEAVQPNTLDEVDRRVKRIYGPNNYEAITDNLPADDPAKKLGRKLHEYSSLGTLGRDVSTSLEAAAILFEEHYSIFRYSKTWVDHSTGSSLVHLVKEKLRSPMYMYFASRRSWLWWEKINERLQRAVEAGILRKLKNDVLQLLQNVGERVNEVDEVPSAEEPHVLGLQALHQPLVLLATGLTLGTLAWLTELVTRACQGRKERKRRKRLLTKYCK